MKDYFQAVQSFKAGGGEIEKGVIYAHEWTEKTPNGSSGLRPITGGNVITITTALLDNSSWFTKTDMASSKSRVEIITANATKLDGTGAVVITVDPQFADFCQDVFEEVRRIVGHDNVAVFPLPGGAIKFYSVKTNPELITIQANVNPIGDLGAKTV